MNDRERAPKISASTTEGYDMTDHAAAEQAHRDDLARDVARIWSSLPARIVDDAHGLYDALDRLAAGYGVGPAAHVPLDGEALRDVDPSQPPTTTARYSAP